MIVELAEKGRLPAIYPYREFVEAGGLMKYGIEIPALVRRAADMAAQILKGAKPSERPIFPPAKFATLAKALGLTVPHELLVSADEVIE